MRKDRIVIVEYDPVWPQMFTEQAHRLHTVQKADMIMILEDGGVREFGARLELLADPGSRFSTLLKTGLEEVLA